ncbi:hypothetical protein [Desulfopila sp. IMCC35008]|uniref:hypothetical protein n=1 Tax=Desulfopila sp. IMCC35008 TaxID=2653858 RepID=UPI0013D13EDF|nr:hypothetical protein [Desulfopila sp. IMCC35008]
MTNAILTGTNHVTEAEVFNVPAVPFTKTFHPVHHGDVIRAIQEAIDVMGMEIVKSEYVLAQDGQRMFGVYDLSQGTNELSWSIGIRNSMNKSMSLGVTAGTRVFVCDNLCFSGEFLAFRRHTSGLDTDELAFLAYRSMRKMIPLLKGFQAWHENLKNYPLTEIDSKILLVEIMTNSVIPPSKFSEFNGLYANVYDDTLWGFHESASHIHKSSNLLSLPQKNKVLNKIIDNYIYSLDNTGSSPLGDFYQQRALISR